MGRGEKPPTAQCRALPAGTPPRPTPAHPRLDQCPHLSSPVTPESSSLLPRALSRSSSAPWCSTQSPLHSGHRAPRCPPPCPRARCPPPCPRAWCPPPCPCARCLSPCPHTWAPFTQNGASFPNRPRCLLCQERPPGPRGPARPRKPFLVQAPSSGTGTGQRRDENGAGRRQRLRPPQGLLAELSRGTRSGVLGQRAVGNGASCRGRDQGPVAGVSHEGVGAAGLRGAARGAAPPTPARQKAPCAL